MSHSAIASTAEPWFFLPLMHLRKKQGVFAHYGHVQSVNALNRIAGDLGDEYVNKLITEFARGVYNGYISKGETYFLDKTPRYYFILEDLIKVFPAAKFVVLLRNPMSVFASSVEAFRGNSMRRLDHLDCDFKIGPARIGEFLQRHNKKTCTVTYENLVEQPAWEVERICRYLEIDFEPAIIDSSFKIELQGYGDHLGARNYNRVMLNVDNWKSIITTRYRRQCLLAHIKRFPSSYLEAGGYDRSALINEARQHRRVTLNAKEYILAVEEAAVKVAKKHYFVARK